MTHYNKFFLLLFLALSLMGQAQIYAPEGINMPGDWDEWSNPPENLVLAGASQTSGGQVIDLPNAIYQTRFQCGTDISAGSYSFKFTSGPTDNLWQNQWGDATFTINTIQSLTYGVGGDDEPDPNSITLTDGKYYVINYDNIGYENTRAICMEMDAEPANIENITHTPIIPQAYEIVTITLELENAPTADFYLVYTTDAWATKVTQPFAFNENIGTIILEGFDDETTVSYYTYSTIIEDAGDDEDLTTIDFDNNGGDYYSFTIGQTIECGSGITLISTNPVFPQADQGVTITFNALMGNGGLAGYEDGDVYAHIGVITSESTSTSDWKYVKTEWGENTDDTQLTRIDDDLYELYIENLTDYFEVPDGETIEEIAMVFRSEEADEYGSYLEGKDTGSQDIFVEVYQDELAVKMTYPTDSDPLVDGNSVLPVCASSLNAEGMELYIDSELLTTETTDQLTYGLNPTTLEAGSHWLVVHATQASQTVYDSVLIFIQDDPTIAELPDGVVAGINYIDDETVTLVLHDPAMEKEFAFVIGDFNNWLVSEESYMNITPGGDYFWVTITGLTPGEEYAFQYYIDGELKIADPYTDKVLDQYNDVYIEETTYPDLKAYPSGQTIGNVSVFQTAQEPFAWEIESFTPEAVNASQSDLVIYELLIRDFVDDRDIASVTEKLDYLEDLGINAIELLPFNEFEGNDSWGYNPSFYFAPDKAYGTKEAYKTFIDECHKRGIAVIMDMVLNHSYSQSPLAQMYWNDATSQPADNNPWYNVSATHPYSPGSDFNHESEYTRAFSKRVMTYWLEEYKIDGYRFDLSKGFTQTYSGDDVDAWGDYDQSRVNIWSDYYDHIKSVNSNAYVILEHLSDNDEEVVLADMGLMLWGKATDEFNQATMGYSSDSDYSWAYYNERGFSYPNLVAYMESHDEERLMYQNLEYGNSYGSYDVTDEATAIERMKAIYPLYYAVPGPKMIWQFGETGYDYSINYCTDGTISDDCRTSAKPIRWDYMDDYNRQELYQVVAAMSKLKTEQEAFESGSYGKDISGYEKRAWISHESMNIVIGGNFDVVAQDMQPSFQSTGTWYNYFTGESFEVSDASGHTLTMEPGGYYVFTDQPLERPYVNLTFETLRDGSPVSGIEILLDDITTSTTDADGLTMFAMGSDQQIAYTVTENGATVTSGTVTLSDDDMLVTINLEGNSIAEQEAEKLALYPNPANTFVRLTSTSQGTLEILSITGNRMASQQVFEGNNTIDVSTLPSGIYIFRLSSEEGVKQGKLIVK